MTLCSHHKFSYVSEQIGVSMAGVELCPCKLSKKEENFHEATWQEVPELKAECILHIQPFQLQNS